MRRVYRCRLYPTATQILAMRILLERLRELYNAALQERRDAYRKTGKSPSCVKQQRSLIEVRKLRPEFAEIHTHLLQDVLTRVERAFTAFFRRCDEMKTGKKIKPGYPRFKSPNRYRTFTFKDVANNNGAKICSGGKRLYLSGIGNVKIKIHRPYEGRIKQISVTLDGDGHWYALLICDDVPAKTLSPTDAETGIDVGLTKFATLANGDVIPNPRIAQKAQRKLATAQRRTRRRKLGGKNRAKARKLESRQHARIRNTRKDFHHKTANDLIAKYGHIAIEDLNLKGLISSRLSKQIHDVAWGQFFTILVAKAESAGRTVVRVDPRGTSQMCSSCGEYVPKDLSVRTHACHACGYTTDRDHNAARNILRLGRSHWGGSSRVP